MTKQHFIALADRIKQYNNGAFEAGSNIVSPIQFSHTQILAIADFCQEQNPNFNRERWLSYIKGECGSNGGKVSKVKTNKLKTAGV